MCVLGDDEEKKEKDNKKNSLGLYILFLFRVRAIFIDSNNIYFLPKWSVRFMLLDWLNIMRPVKKHFLVNMFFFLLIVFFLQLYKKPVYPEKRLF